MSLPMMLIPLDNMTLDVKEASIHWMPCLKAAAVYGLAMPSQRWCGVVTLCKLVITSRNCLVSSPPWFMCPQPLCSLDSCFPHHHSLPEYDGYYCGGLLEVEQEEVSIKVCRFRPGHVQSVVNVANPSHAWPLPHVALITITMIKSKGKWDINNKIQQPVSSCLTTVVLVLPWPVTRAMTFD